MINVYVIDDEKLVRRGIIGLIDWEKYDMKVVGDSGSSEETIQFMEMNQVDLLFSDLEMPGLSGISFLVRVKEVCPEVQIVVLTMHQEFEMIQNALRVGILDYITKAQIEEENVDTFMKSVKRRYLNTRYESKVKKRTIEWHTIYIWEFADHMKHDEVTALLDKEQISYEALSENQLLFSGECNVIQLKGIIEHYDLDDSTLFEVKQVKDVTYDQLKHVLQTALKRRVFSDRRPGRFHYSYIYPKIQKEGSGISREEILEMTRNTRFITDVDEYNKVLDEVKYVGLIPEERTAVFYHFNLFWSDFSGKDISCYFDEVSLFKWWYQWKVWFDEIRVGVLEKIGNIKLDPDTVDLIHKAMIYTREHMDQDLTLEDVLHLCGMSRSYFSRSFKKITGETYVTYLNNMRIQSAKSYLIETNQPVYWVATQVGYSDEHYFGRVFKDKTGKTPKQYREKYKKQSYRKELMYGEDCHGSME